MTPRPRNAKTRKAFLKSRWQKAIDAKEQGRPDGLCAYMIRGIWTPCPDPDCEAEAVRLRELFDDTRRADWYTYLWSDPLWRDDRDDRDRDVDPDETARIIAAVIMRETVE